MVDVKSHQRKTKSGKLIQVNTFNRVGESKKKSVSMRSEVRAVVDKPNTPKSHTQKPNPNMKKALIKKPNKLNSGFESQVKIPKNAELIEKRYKITQRILMAFIHKFGSIEKARENPEYQKLIKIQSDRLKMFKKMVKAEQNEKKANSNEKVRK